MNIQLFNSPSGETFYGYLSDDGKNAFGILKDDAQFDVALIKLSLSENKEPRKMGEEQVFNGELTIMHGTHSKKYSTRYLTDQAVSYKDIPLFTATLMAQKAYIIINSDLRPTEVSIPEQHFKEFKNFINLANLMGRPRIDESEYFGPLERNKVNFILEEYIEVESRDTTSDTCHY